MKHPKHRNPSTERTATAPYNFIPLPDSIVEADPLPDHNTFALGRHTGYFDVQLTTKSPLYIRGPLTAEQFKYQETDHYADGKPIPSRNIEFMRLVRNLPHFFYTANPGAPVIPGSSLRGMLRTLVEIATFGKLTRITDKGLFYRTVDASSIGLEYNRRMVENLGYVSKPGQFSAPSYKAKVRAGFIRAQPDGSYKIEECAIARVEEDKLLTLFDLQEARELYELNGRPLNDRTERNPNQTPRWSYQHQTVSVVADPSEDHHPFREKRDPGRHIHPNLYLWMRRVRAISQTRLPNSTLGTLVLTGHMQSKHMHFVFLHNGGTPKMFDLPNDPDEEDPNKRILDRFHDDDQMTQWQQAAFPKGKPSGTDRRQNGFIRDGEPVFFLTDNEGKGDNIVFFGRAFMFRLPYVKRPNDLVPKVLCDPNKIDMAEAMFGFVRTRQELAQMNPTPKQGDKRRAYSGRVFVTNAVLDPPNQSDLFEAEQTPKILATPKPTAFQHYLTQNSDNKDDLHHYDTETNDERGQIEPVIRGHKLYWHRSGLRRTVPETEVQEHSTQHTRIKPVREDNTFRFRVYFDNLSDAELGALAWVLAPQGPAKTYCQRLGMGKSLGYGSIQLEPSLHLMSPINSDTNDMSSDESKFIARYESLFEVAENEQIQFATGLREVAVTAWRDKFAAAMSRHPSLANETAIFHQIPRIAMLLKMLEYPGPSCSKTEGLPISGGSLTFRDRPILPDPLNLEGVNRTRDRSRTQAALQREQDRAQPVAAPTLPQPEPEKIVIVTEASKYAQALMNRRVHPSEIGPGDLLTGKSLYDPPEQLIQIESVDPDVAIYAITSEEKTTFSAGTLVTLEVTSVDRGDPYEIYVTARLVSRDD